MVRSFALVVLAILLAGCSSGPVALEVDQLAGWGSYPPQPYIQVLSEPPDQPYVPIARLTATGAAGLDQAQLLTVLQDRARALGANAIILKDETPAPSPNLTYNPAGGEYSLAPTQTQPKFVGLAIHVGAENTGQ